MTIDDILANVLKAEGGYTNNPNDAGGETNWGITLAAARANGYTGPMRDLPRDRALEIYRRRYVNAPGFDKIAVISPGIAAELVDTGVNMGPKVAATFLQRALNALGANLAADGETGSATREALKAFLNKRGQQGEIVMLRALNALQAERYISLSETRPANKEFTFGWLFNRVAL